MLTLTDDKLLKFVLILGKSCVVFVWGEKLGWPRTLFIILLEEFKAPDYLKSLEPAITSFHRNLELEKSREAGELEIIENTMENDIEMLETFLQGQV